MARYEFTKTKIDRETNREVYNTTIYRKLPERNDDIYFNSQDGDRCDNLAFRFYGHSSLWWFIAKVNDLKTMNIPPGISLRIPLKPTEAIGL